jgi:hypothetical protein
MIRFELFDRSAASRTVKPEECSKAGAYYRVIGVYSDNDKTSL